MAEFNLPLEKFERYYKSNHEHAKIMLDTAQRDLDAYMVAYEIAASELTQFLTLKERLISE